jgi:SAM-dependent methyltransferase
VGPFDVRFRHLADWDLAVRLAEAGPPAAVPDPLVGYRIHKTGASSDNADLPSELERFAREHAWRQPGRAVDRAEVWRWMAASSLRAGRRWSAARAYARAARAGDAAAAPRALVAALDPLASRHALALRHRGDVELAQRADGWLAPLRPRLDRPRLPEAELRQAAADRLSPSPGQFDHLHLRGLRDGLAEVLATVPADGPGLDLYCGVQPYAPLVPSRPLWGLDLDHHFGRADVLARTELPFAGGAFSLVLCSQALILVDDDVRTVEEVRRVLAPGGTAVITVSGLYRRGTHWERRYTVGQLERLFRAFDRVEVHLIDSLGAAGAYVVGTLLNSVALRSRLAAPRLPAVMRGVDAAGRAVDGLLGPLRRRFPHSLILVARRSG